MLGSVLMAIFFGALGVLQTNSPSSSTSHDVFVFIATSAGVLIVVGVLVLLFQVLAAPVRQRNDARHELMTLQYSVELERATKATERAEAETMRLRELRKIIREMKKDCDALRKMLQTAMTYEEWRGEGFIGTLGPLVSGQGHVTQLAEWERLDDIYQAASDMYAAYSAVQGLATQCHMEWRLQPHNQTFVPLNGPELLKQLAAQIDVLAPLLNAELANLRGLAEPLLDGRSAAFPPPAP